MPSRTAIPANLRRQVLMEAGHCCAIPTCKSYPVEVAHIVPWSTCKKHEFENLITLCTACHTRYDRGEIDRQSVKAYKSNLAIMNGRYSDMERRILKTFAESETSEAEVILPRVLSFTFSYLIEDALLEDLGPLRGNAQLMVGVGTTDSANTFNSYRLTTQGLEFLRTWIEGKELS